MFCITDFEVGKKSITIQVPIPAAFCAIPVFCIRGYVLYMLSKLKDVSLKLSVEEELILGGSLHLETVSQISRKITKPD